MLARVMTMACCVLLGSAVRADLIAITNPDFATDLSGWTPQESSVGDTEWEWSGGDELSGPSARLRANTPNVTATLFQSFASTGVIPGQVIDASLTWTQYLNALNPSAWGATQSFRVLLADASSNTIEVFSTDGRPPEYGTFGTGAPANEEDTGDLIAFLNQLALGETITLTFEASTSGTMLAAVDDIQFSFDLAPQAVPEPSSLAFSGLGLAGLLWMKRKRRSATPVRA